MPCGLTMDYLYQRLKEAAEEGSPAAISLLEDFMALQDKASEDTSLTELTEGGTDGR